MTNPALRRKCDIVRGDFIKTTALSAALCLFVGTGNAGTPDASVIPSDAHLKYQDREIMALIHWGPNTYTGQEWGFGNVPPSVVVPSRLDPVQWVAAMKAAEIKSAVLVTKHHDGFCLWPSKDNPGYSMSAVPAPNTGRDIVREMSDAYRREGLGFGVYLSPWDRHQASYAKPEYVDYFFAQWDDLMSNYGELCEIWLDGANGGNGWYGGANGGKGETRSIPKDYYRLPRLLEKMHAKHPMAVAFSGGGDWSTAWCGNEKGWSPETWWCPRKAADGKFHWMPSEADFPLRGGWFWHQEQKPKSLLQLTTAYFETVGRGAVMNLGIAPDKEGRICDEDVRRLAEFGEWVREFNRTDFAKEAKIQSISQENRLVMELALPKAARFACVDIREDIAKGQRISSFEVEVYCDGTWKPVGKGSTVGHRRIVRFDEIESDKVRVTFSGIAPPQVLSVALRPVPEVTEDDGMRAKDTYPKGKWRIIYETCREMLTAKNAIDGNYDTLWNTHPVGRSPFAPPQSFTVDCGELLNMRGFDYTPRHDGTLNGMVDGYEFHVSADGSDWKLAAAGEFGNLAANPVRQRVMFAAPMFARYFRFTATHALNGNDRIALAEIDLVAQKSAWATAIGGRIAAKHKILKEDVWHGFPRTVFNFNGHTAWVVSPKVAAAEGRPWTWTMQWADAFVERTGVTDLLARGWHHVTIDTFRHRMDEEGLKVSRKFQSYLVDELGFAAKARLVGMSWGGFFSVRYATRYPQCVSCVFLDAPLLNFDGFSHAAGKTGGALAAAIGPWANRLPAGGAKWSDDREMPLNMAETLAAYKVPLLLVYGDNDETVPSQFNSEPFAERFKAEGGKIDVRRENGRGHHPHGFPPEQIKTLVDFFECSADEIAETTGRRDKKEALDAALWNESEWISAVDAPVYAGKGEDGARAADGASWFVREIRNEGKVASAKWMTSGLGVYEVYVNGKRIGEEALKPGFTHVKKTRRSFTYDVTECFKKGEGEKNFLAAEVTGGWWRDKIANFTGKKSAFRSVLELTYADGTVKVIGTRAGEWMAGIGGPVKHAAIFDGEEYDKRVEAPYFGSASFKPAERNDEFRGEILPSEGGEVVRRFDLALKPVAAYVWRGVDGADESKKVFGTVHKLRDVEMLDGDDGNKGGLLKDCTLAKGETLVVDFGQNCAGVPVFVFAAAEGTVLTCLPAEMLNDGNGERTRGNDGPAGSVYRENLRIPDRGMRIVYTFGATRNDQTTVYMPMHTFFGYRYISVTATADVTITAVASVPVTSIRKEMELGKIETGVDDVNRLISNVYWGQLSNYLSVPTDCPQRNERLGWTADAQVFTEAGAFNADTSSFFHKWMRDIRDTQDPRGGFPGIAPHSQIVGQMRLGWSDAGVIVPYQIWKQFADTKIVEENWEAMEKYLARLAETKGEYEATKGENGGYQWADWLSYEAFESSGGGAWKDGTWRNGKVRPEARIYWNYLYACYWYWDAIMMKELAAATCRDADKYAAMASQAMEYIKKSFLEADGLVAKPLRGMQTPALFAIKLNLVEGEAKVKTIKALRRNFAEHGDCLQTGFLGTSILMETLSANGMTDIAYTLLLQHKNPSWLYSVDQGATTIWERWNSYTKEKGFGPVRMNSFNHYAYGAVLAWIYKDAAGIAADPKAPGFRNIVMAPKPDRRLGYVKAEYKTAYGVVKSAWRYEGEKWIWNFTIPEGATADVTLPGDSVAKRYAAGAYHVACQPGLHELQRRQATYCSQKGH